MTILENPTLVFKFVKFISFDTVTRKNVLKIQHFALAYSVLTYIHRVSYHSDP